MEQIKAELIDLKDALPTIKGFGGIDQHALEIVTETITKVLDMIDKEAYSLEDIEKCVENWGLCKVEGEYIKKFLER